MTPERPLASQEEEELFAMKLALPLHYSEWTDERENGRETMWSPCADLFSSYVIYVFAACSRLYPCLFFSKRVYGEGQVSVFAAGSTAIPLRPATIRFLAGPNLLVLYCGGRRRCEQRRAGSFPFPAWGCCTVSLKATQLPVGLFAGVNGWSVASA